MARIFYVHWNEQEAGNAVGALRAGGHTVRAETASGKSAWEALKADPPDVLVVCLDRLPSHGRRTAAVTTESARLRTLPMVFVGGEPDKVAAAKSQFPRAAFCGSDQLLQTIERVTGNSGEVPPGRACGAPPAQGRTRKSGAGRPRMDRPGPKKSARRSRRTA
jgi:hypothetical protein